MPLYELLIICKIGETSAMGTLLKNVSSVILSQGGVVRGYENLGDRIQSKNLKAQDGNKYGVARWIAIEFDGSPALVEQAATAARASTETLRTYVHKLKENEYMSRVMKRLN